MMQKENRKRQNGVGEKKRAKKDKRMRAVFPAKRTAEKAGTLCRTFFLHFTSCRQANKAELSKVDMYFFLTKHGFQIF